MKTDTAVKTNNLTKFFHQKAAVDTVSMNVSKGSIYGFLGANGAGKTTIFKMLTGLLTPSSGTGTILGFDIVTDKIKYLSKIGVLIETPTFYEHLSAVENMEIHLSYMGVDDVDILHTLKKVGLQDTGLQPVGSYSLGMRQRLAIARSFIHRPELLILDEPINGLDPMGIRDMRCLFLELSKKQGITILLSSHILSEIQYVADRIGVIAGGQLIKELDCSDIQEKHGLELEDYFLELMGGYSNG